MIQIRFDPVFKITTGDDRILSLRSHNSFVDLSNYRAITLIPNGV